jgi:hypothetical protein
VEGAEEGGGYGDVIAGGGRVDGDHWHGVFIVSYGSCRTGLLRGGRPLRGVCTGLGGRKVWGLALLGALGEDCA